LAAAFLALWESGFWIADLRFFDWYCGVQIC
jgi:hypothetical protein